MKPMLWRYCTDARWQLMRLHSIQITLSEQSRSEMLSFNKRTGKRWMSD